MNHATITFIGAGNMARAIIGGLLRNGYPADRIRATGRSLEKLQDLAEQGLRVFTDNHAAIEQADAIVLSVKPQMMKAVVTDLAPSIQGSPLFISVAAGISANSIQSWLGGDFAVVRSMPNTPSLVGKGASGLYANAEVSAGQRALAESIATATGIALWVDDEALIHAVTAVSGSGPAYYFLFMEAMIAEAKAQGLDQEAATRLTLQTALGAAEMASQSDVDPTELRHRVTSPNGTTEQAIKTFQTQGLENLVAKAMQACSARSQAMAKELGDD